MVDNVELTSAASSDISESLREQILGKSYRRRKPKLAKTSPIPNSLFGAPYEVVPSKETSFEVATAYLENNNNKNTDSNHKETVEKLKQSEISTIDDTVPSTNGTKFNPIHTSSRQSIDLQNKGINSSKVLLQMSQMEKKQFQSTETQTVPIQTVSAEIDARGDCHCKECSCNPCEPPNCTFDLRSKKLMPISETTSNTTIFNGYSESSNNSLEVKYQIPKYFKCNCQDNWSEGDSSTVQISDSDDESYANDFLDLPYQNNEEYLKLLKELEKKLVARNRDRVRRTMVEFERLSRQNQSLKKPIFDYEADASTTFIKKFGSKLRKKAVCCKCGRNKKVNSDIMQNEKKWDHMKLAPIASNNEHNCAPEAKNCVSNSMRKSHWRLNPRTGEWIKVSCFEQTDFVRPEAPFCKEGFQKVGNDCDGNCCCRQKKKKINQFL